MIGCVEVRRAQIPGGQAFAGHCGRPKACCSKRSTRLTKNGGNRAFGFVYSFTHNCGCWAEVASG